MILTLSGDSAQSDHFVRHLEGDPSQSEGLEVSLGSLHRAEDEAFLAGADVVQAVTVQGAHTGGRENKGEKKGIFDNNKILAKETILIL